MNVNYMIEINALDEWELTHPLDSTAYKVMRKLLYLSNKERFPEWISVRNTVLMSLVGCSEDSLIKARTRLINVGLINYKGQKKMTPIYAINYFSHNPLYNPKLRGIEQGMEQGIERGIKQGVEQGIKHGTYINKTKGEETSGNQNGGEEDILGVASAGRAFPRRTRTLRPEEKACYDGLYLQFAQSPLFQGRQAILVPMINSDRFNLDIIIEAYEMTIRRNNRYELYEPAAYLMELLFDWERRGLKTPEDVRHAKDDYWGD